MKKIISFLLIILTLLSSSSCSIFNTKSHLEATTEPVEIETTDVNDFVEDVVYTETTTKEILKDEEYKYHKAIDEVFDYKLTEDLNRKMYKWNQTIKVRIIGDYTDKDKQMVEYVINKINYQENVPNIVLTKKGEAPNFVIAFGSYNYLYRNFTSSSCLYDCESIVACDPKEKYIEHVTAYVKTQSAPGKQLRCISRVFIEGIGIGQLESWTNEIDSVFNLNSESTYYSEFDNLLISLFYDDDIPSGKDVEYVVDELKRRLSKTYDFTTTTTTTTVATTPISNVFATHTMSNTQ